MKILLLISLIVQMQAIRAETFRSKIDSIEPGRGDGPYLIKMQSGRVGFLPQGSGLMDEIKKAHNDRMTLEFEVNEENKIISIENSKTTDCTDPQSYRPKACENFGIP